MFESFVDLVREIYPDKKNIPLHEPYFTQKERQYIEEAIESTYVSTVGQHVDIFEEKVSKYTGIKHAIATVNGTAALHAALLSIGANDTDEILTQSLNFVAGCNAIRYCGSYPVFIDIEEETLGLDPKELEKFLNENAEPKNGQAWNKNTKKYIKACILMHTFGIPSNIKEISDLCKKWNICLIEDAAEALGSFEDDKHVGKLGDIAILSFNGNKIITSGGGGMVLTDNDELAKNIRHITTTAKVSHQWEFFHDEVGYNYRMPNINAALGLGQFENLEAKLESKESIYLRYKKWSEKNGNILFVHKKSSKPNYWLNTLILENETEKNEFLNYTNEKGIQTRPAWTPMHKLPPYEEYKHNELKITEYIFERTVSIPSSPIKS